MLFLNCLIIRSYAKYSLAGELQMEKLEGSLVTLEPLSKTHILEVKDPAANAELWNYMTFELANAASLELFVINVCRLSEFGNAHYFAIRNNNTSKVIGGSGIDYDAAMQKIEKSFTS